MNRRELLKKIGLGGAVAAAVAVAPKVPETVAEVLDPTGKLGIELPPPPGAAPAVYDNSGLGGVPGAIRHLVRERAHGRPMGYMESEDGSKIHWHATKGNGEIVTGTVDKLNPNFAGKNGLAYYAMQEGTNYTNPGRVRFDEAVREIREIQGGVSAHDFGSGVNPFEEAPD